MKTEDGDNSSKLATKSLKRNDNITVSYESLTEHSIASVPLDRPGMYSQSMEINDSIFDEIPGDTKTRPENERCDLNDIYHQGDDHRESDARSVTSRNSDRLKLYRTSTHFIPNEQGLVRSLDSLKDVAPDLEIETDDKKIEEIQYCDTTSDKVMTNENKDDIRIHQERIKTYDNTEIKSPSECIISHSSNTEHDETISKKDQELLEQNIDKIFNCNSSKSFVNDGYNSESGCESHLVDTISKTVDDLKGTNNKEGVVNDSANMASSISNNHQRDMTESCEDFTNSQLSSIQKHDLKTPKCTPPSVDLVHHKCNIVSSVTCQPSKVGLESSDSDTLPEYKSLMRPMSPNAPRRYSSPFDTMKTIDPKYTKSLVNDEKESYDKKISDFTEKYINNLVDVEPSQIECGNVDQTDQCYDAKNYSTQIIKESTVCQVQDIPEFNKNNKNIGISPIHDVHEISDNIITDKPTSHMPVIPAFTENINKSIKYINHNHINSNTQLIREINLESRSIIPKLNTNILQENKTNFIENISQYNNQDKNKINSDVTQNTRNSNNEYMQNKHTNRNIPELKDTFVKEIKESTIQNLPIFNDRTDHNMKSPSKVNMSTITSDVIRIHTTVPIQHIPEYSTQPITNEHVTTKDNNALYANECIEESVIIPIKYVPISTGKIINDQLKTITYDGYDKYHSELERTSSNRSKSGEYNPSDTSLNKVTDTNGNVKFERTTSQNKSSRKSSIPSSQIINNCDSLNNNTIEKIKETNTTSELSRNILFSQNIKNPIEALLNKKIIGGKNYNKSKFNNDIHYSKTIDVHGSREQYAQEVMNADNHDDIIDPYPKYFNLKDIKLNRYDLQSLKVGGRYSKSPLHNIKDAITLSRESRNSKVENVPNENISLRLHKLSANKIGTQLPDTGYINNNRRSQSISPSIYNNEYSQIEPNLITQEDILNSTNEAPSNYLDNRLAVNKRKYSLDENKISSHKLYYGSEANEELSVDKHRILRKDNLSNSKLAVNIYQDIQHSNEVKMKHHINRNNVRKETDSRHEFDETLTREHSLQRSEIGSRRTKRTKSSSSKRRNTFENRHRNSVAENNGYKPSSTERNERRLIKNRNRLLDHIKTIHHAGPDNDRYRRSTASSSRREITGYHGDDDDVEITTDSILKRHTHAASHTDAQYAIPAYHTYRDSGAGLTRSRSCTKLDVGASTSTKMSVKRCLSSGHTLDHQRVARKGEDAGSNASRNKKSKSKKKRKMSLGELLKVKANLKKTKHVGDNGCETTTADNSNAHQNKAERYRAFQTNIEANINDNEVIIIYLIH